MCMTLSGLARPLTTNSGDRSLGPQARMARALPTEAIFRPQLLTLKSTSASPQL